MNTYLQDSRLDKLTGFSGNSIAVDILRTDLIHPVVSGNKWFKLRYYLEEAIALKKERIVSFGGAYSNHIVATAFAAREAGLKSMGIIRGEKAEQLSHTLVHAASYGMELVFVERSAYRDKQSIMEQYNLPGSYWVNEGGYGKTGAKGAAGMLDFPNSDLYTHILCATGTGTMMAGLIKAAQQHQEVIGISVLKNHFSLEAEVKSLLEESERLKKFSFIHGYHFGGYAKHPEILLSFMKETWESWQLPTDIVYTSKLLFGVKDLINKNHFPRGSRLLVIHSGGLQGNLSLPLNTLPF